MYLNECVSCEVIVLIPLILVLHPFNARATATEAYVVWFIACWSFLIRQLHLWARNNQCFVVIDNKGSRSLLLWHNKQVHKKFVMHTFCNDGLVFQAFQTIPPLEVNAKIAPIILWYSYHDVHFNVMFVQHEAEKKMFVQQTQNHPILY